MSRAVKKPDPPHKMEFATNSLRNTTVAVEDDLYYFEVVTRFWHPSVTKINRLDVDTREMKTVAEIERIKGREPKVRFLQSSEKEAQLGDWTKASEFMKYDPNRVSVGTLFYPPPTPPDPPIFSGGIFTTTDGTNFRWKTHNRKLRLIKAEDEEKKPIVQYHAYRRYFWIFRMSRHAWLEVQPEMTDSLEKVIVSYLLVERRRRDAILRLRLEHSA